MKKKSHIRTEWNLKLLYTSLDDPQIERDMQSLERAARTFRARWQKRTDYLTDKTQLAAALREYERMTEILSSPKGFWYASLSVHMNSENKKASAMQTKLEERYTKAGNMIRFFSLALGTIAPKKQKEFLFAPSLARYRYMLAREFETARYNLTEKEEELMSLLSIPANSLWVKMTEREVHKLSVTVGKKQIPLEQAQSKIPHLPKIERHAVARVINEKLATLGDIAASEINALVIDHKISDEKRGFDAPYTSTILAYQNDRQTVLNLAKTVTDHFHISEHFYALHARLLKEKKIEMSDRNVEIGTISKKFPFDTAAAIVRESLRSVDGQYADIFDDYLTRGQIDVHPRKGKHSGGYCWNINACPTFILLNHNDTVRSVETLGHEMGHAIHAELSNTQPVLYRDHSMSVAETASTFFEQVTTERIMDMLPDKDKIIMLHKQIANDISSIFRQIACFNFEVELHERIRKEGELSGSDIASLLRKHMSAYLGKAVTVTDEDGYFFITWSHIRYQFYVYSYAYGQLISKTLFAHWKKDKAFAEKIRQFLSAGASDTPEQIFKSIGINVQHPSFFKAGLAEINDSISRLEALAFGTKKKK